jgi:ribosomal protein S18 acetylase RimI-like enzyme
LLCEMITLELITPQNATLFKDVRLRALQDTPTAFSSTYAKESQLSDADWVARAAQWTNERSATYLALDAKIPCGIASGILDKDDAKCAHLLSMWVAPMHRRSGIGRKLVKAIIDWSRAHGVCTLQLIVTSNNDNAIKFYEHLGFVLTGKTAPYRNDPALNDLEMNRWIS